MAEVRIIERWVRAPGAAPTQGRTVMVVAARWSEQRVLMRAFASALDRTQPTITLCGRQYAMSPAGVDAQGAWGLHVPQGEDPEALVEELTRAASRRPQQRSPSSSSLPAARGRQSASWFQPPPRPRQTSSVGRRTLPGFASPLTPVASASPVHASPSEPSAASLFGRTMPAGFQLHPWERQVLELLARRRRIRGHEVASLTGGGDAHVLMQRLVAKLHRLGVDIILAEGDGYRLQSPS